MARMLSGLVSWILTGLVLVAIAAFIALGLLNKDFSDKLLSFSLSIAIGVLSLAARQARRDPANQ